MRKTYGELWQEWLKIMEIQPDSPYQIIDAQNEQIEHLKARVKQLAINEARLIALVDALMARDNAA